MWTVTTRVSESPLLKHRLLPAEYELRDGNAAPILLRLPWDQTAYMNTIPRKLPDMLQIPIADAGRIRAAGEEIMFDRINFYSEMRRAAYRRTADWEYPIDERPVESILLPDVQGSRDFMRGLAVWIRLQIVNDKLDDAREGILVGLANARHYGRTPFLITNLVAANHVRLMLDRLEELLQHPQCPNLYWAICALPSPLLDVRPAYEFECEFLQRSVDGLRDLDQIRSPAQWQELADRTLRYFREMEAAGQRRDPDAKERAAAERLMPAAARKELPMLSLALADRVAAMSDGELMVRWFIAIHIEQSERAAAAVNLDFPHAIERLCAHDEAIDQFKARWKTHCILSAWSATTYAHFRYVDRHLAALRIVEAVRDHAATHDGKVPSSLREIVDHPAPNDPFTGAPFDYAPMDDARGFQLTGPIPKALSLHSSGEVQNLGIDWQVKVNQP